MSDNIAKILLVDDDVGLLKLLSMRLKSANYEVESVTSAKDALLLIPEYKPQLVITDLKMDGMDGMELFYKIDDYYPGLPVIMITAHGSIPDAVNATQKGVFSFLAKPIDKNDLLAKIEYALKISGGVNTLDSGSAGSSWNSKIQTNSKVMVELFEQAKLLAKSNVNVLILGKSGTGKEVLARAIHEASEKREGPFIAVNCGALPDLLLESELFGHAKGSFTGAIRDHLGLFQEAHGGTLFLDEIGDMPLPLQVKLLRVIQEKKVRPVGHTKSILIDVRIISATHRNLTEKMDKGEFREDLYYRLNVASLVLPTLEERCEDIPLLANFFLNKFKSLNSSHVEAFSPQALQVLAESSWPGNIRQLENVVEQAIVLSTNPVISESLIKKALKTPKREIPSFQEARELFEKDYLTKLMYVTGGQVSEAAKIAKRNRTDFYKLLSKYKLRAEKFKE